MIFLKQIQDQKSNADDFYDSKKLVCLWKMSYFVFYYMFRDSQCFF